MIRGNSVLVAFQRDLFAKLIPGKGGNQPGMAIQPGKIFGNIFGSAAVDKGNVAVFLGEPGIVVYVIGIENAENIQRRGANNDGIALVLKDISPAADQTGLCEICDVNGNGRACQVQ